MPDTDHIAARMLRDAAALDADDPGQDIHDARQLLDLTREAMARKLGCSIHAVKSWERGTRRPSRESCAALHDLADTLDS